MRSAVGILASIGALMVAGCNLVPSPPLPTIPAGATINCDALPDGPLCRTAVQVAITAQLNPPPISVASLRRPSADDDCFTAPNPCLAGSIIVTLQSGDTLQEVVLRPSGNGWALLEQPR